MQAMQEALPEQVSCDWHSERGLDWRDGGCEREWPGEDGQVMPGENGQVNSFARGKGQLGMKERDWREAAAFSISVPWCLSPWETGGGFCGIEEGCGLNKKRV